MPWIYYTGWLAAGICFVVACWLLDELATERRAAWYTQRALEHWRAMYARLQDARRAEDLS